MVNFSHKLKHDTLFLFFPEIYRGGYFSWGVVSTSTTIQSYWRKWTMLFHNLLSVGSHKSCCMCWKTDLSLLALFFTLFFFKIKNLGILVFFVDNEGKYIFLKVENRTLCTHHVDEINFACICKVENNTLYIPHMDEIMWHLSVK